MGAFIKAVSYYLPEGTLTNTDLARLFPEWEESKIEKKLGVKKRHIVTKDETAADLAYMAAKRLMEENCISEQSIDFILLCTQSPDYFLPTTACLLQARLGIPTTAGALDFNLGCSGCIYGLALAKGLIEAQIARNVLLITAETYSKYIEEDDKGNRSIFGDGAAACLISTDGMAQIGEFVLGTDGNGAEHLIVRTGAARHPDKTGKFEVDEEGHKKHDDHLYMNGGAIFNFTLEKLPELVDGILKKNHINANGVDFYIFHQANKFMLNTIRKVCGIPVDKFYIDMTQTGNTVSSTVLIGLKESLDSGLIKKGDTVIITGFGVGLSWGGTCLRF